MIQNLNPVSFREFGTVLSERHQMKRIFGRNTKAIPLESMEAPLYQAKGETRLDCASGMSVLSVSSDGEHYFDFYLDKTVGIHTGMYFQVIPFLGSCTVEMTTKTEPELIGTRNCTSLRIENRMRVEGLYTFFYQEKEQGFLFSGEAHPMPELTYVDQGSLHSVADGQDLLLEQGDIVIYGPNQWHMQHADIGVAPRFVTISFDFSGGDLTPLLNRKFSAPQKVVTLLQHMLREQERMDIYSNDIIIAQLNLLLLALLREAEKPDTGKLQATNALHNENQIVQQAQIFISEHIREKLSVPMVAKKVDVSPSYLTALFHKNLQISPGEYIRRIKLQESKQMIRENDLTFTEIAAALKYSTVHHFSRQFKEKFGITPTQYARSVR